MTRRAYEHYVPIIGREPMPMVEDYAPRIADGQVWLLEEDRRVAGLLVLEDRGDALLIYSVAIAPERQHAGLGQQLLAFAEELGRREGYAVLELFTNARMERNIGIYRRFGFTETGRREHPDRPGFFIVFMEKKLAPSEARRSA
jgi:ribosomal protein S18 acetylase RimI-like enzyme